MAEAPASAATSPVAGPFPDVIVYGATAAGVMAALGARTVGASVRLVEPGRHVGGMVSGGLGWTDFGCLDVVAGLARRFYERVAAHYATATFALRGPEPHVAEALFESLLEDAGVEVVVGAPLREVSLSGVRISQLAAGPPPAGSHRAAAYVDASYEGDLMAAAGVPYRVGREDRRLHGESWAGRQPAYRPGTHNFSMRISPFTGAGGNEGLLPFVRPPDLDSRGWPSERLGEGDGALQAYCLRLCMTDRRENQLPIDEPAGYDPDRFALLARYLAVAGEQLRASDLLGLVPDLLPRGKCDVNSIGPFSLNLLDGTNRRYPDGDEQTRREIREAHIAYSHALLRFLRSAPEVPAHVRGEMGRWSLCADEFVDSAGWPHQLYVRDARRMVGALVLVERDLAEGRRRRDDVAVGSYNIDVRELERTWRYLPEYHRQAAVFNEGYLSLAVPPYGIPYRCLVPEPEHCDNLVVPVCCSVSHVAFGSVRTEPTLMALGEAAGTAAALAAVDGVTVQGVKVERLLAALAANARG